jgi:hypothetical protein
MAIRAGGWLASQQIEARGSGKWALKRHGVRRRRSGSMKWAELAKTGAGGAARQRQSTKSNQ